MKLLTEEQRTKLLANGTRRGPDHEPVVKLFNPCGAGTWLLSELDPEYPNECGFGLADLGFGTPESGSIGLLELTQYRGPFGLGIERDIHFTASYPLSIYAEAARAAGHIVESGPELEAAARVLAGKPRRRRSFGKAGEPAATDGTPKRQGGVPPPPTLNGGAATASPARSTNPARTCAKPQAGESRCRSRRRGKRRAARGSRPRRNSSIPRASLEHAMTDPDTISADYSLRPSELASTLALLVEARQPVVVWGAPGCAKSQIAQQVAAQAGREYVDVRALLLDPVDLRGIPWRDGADRTRWAPPAFLPPSDADGSWLINLEELPSALPMVAGGPVSARARPQMRRVRTPRGRRVDRLRQPRGRSRRRPPHAHTARLAFRPSGNPGRCDGLVFLGRGKWNRGRDSLFHPNAARALRGIPVARRRRPHPLGAACLPAAVRRGRKLADQSGGTALGSADGAGGPVSARARPQMRRVRTPRGRRADRLRQTARATAASSTACRRRSPRASSIWRSGSMRRTGAPGVQQMESLRRSFSSCRCAPSFWHAFNPQSTEKAFPCPRTWEMVSNIVHRRGGLDPVAERALFRGTVGEAAAVEFSAFLHVWHELPHPRTVIDDPEGAVVPGNASALIALCGSLYRMADDINLGAIVTYATRLRREVGEFPRRLLHPPASPRSSTPRPSSSGPPPRPADPISFWRPMP